MKMQRHRFKIISVTLMIAAFFLPDEPALTIMLAALVAAFIDYELRKMAQRAVSKHGKPIKAEPSNESVPATGSGVVRDWMHEQVLKQMESHPPGTCAVCDEKRKRQQNHD